MKPVAMNSLAILKRQPADREGYEKRDEVPFDFERRRVSIVVDTPAPGEDRILITKGAPEGIVALAASYEAGGQTMALSEDARRRIQGIYNAWSAQGYRGARRGLPKRRRTHGVLG